MVASEVAYPRGNYRHGKVYVYERNGNDNGWVLRDQLLKCTVNGADIGIEPGCAVASYDDFGNALAAGVAVLNTFLRSTPTLEEGHAGVAGVKK